MSERGRLYLFFGLSLAASSLCHSGPRGENLAVASNRGLGIICTPPIATERKPPSLIWSQDKAGCAFSACLPAVLLLHYSTRLAESRSGAWKAKHGLAGGIVVGTASRIDGSRMLAASPRSKLGGHRYSQFAAIRTHSPPKTASHALPDSRMEFDGRSGDANKMGSSQSLQVNSAVKIRANARDQMMGYGWRDDTMNQTIGRVGVISQVLKGGVATPPSCLLCIVDFGSTRGLEWLGKKVFLSSCLDEVEFSQDEAAEAQQELVESQHCRSGPETDTSNSEGAATPSGPIAAIGGEADVDVKKNLCELEAEIQESLSRLNSLVNFAKSELGARNVSWDRVAQGTAFGQEVEKVRNELDAISKGVEGLVDSQLRYGSERRIGMPLTPANKEPKGSGEEQGEEGSLAEDGDSLWESWDSRVGMPRYNDIMPTVGEIVSSMPFPAGSTKAENSRQGGSEVPTSASSSSSSSSSSSLSSPQSAANGKGKRIVKRIRVSETQHIKVMEHDEKVDDDEGEDQGGGDFEEVEENLQEASLLMEDGATVNFAIIPRPYYHPKTDVDLNPLYASERKGTGIIAMQMAVSGSKYEQLWAQKSRRVQREAILEKREEESQSDQQPESD